jgi:Holliday junction DNA helicase RuvB
MDPVTLGKVALQASRTRSVLLVDEIHGLARRTQEMLFPIMDDGIMRLGGQEVPCPLTVFGTTTEIAKLLEPLRNRFSITLFVDAYSDEEIERIGEGMCRKMELDATPEGLRYLAHRARGIPRLMQGFLDRVRDVEPSLTEEAARRALVDLGYNEEGLTTSEHWYILSLYVAGGKASLQSLSSEMQQDPISLKSIEAYLISVGYVQITTGGRSLTGKGLAYALDAIERLTKNP